ncbi:unnamed protein product [Urochloa humidicola]
MEGAAQTLVTNFGVLVGEELQKLRGVGGEVAQLRDELATMNALLRMQSEAEPGAVDHFLREWMKQLRELAYDAEDCVHLYTFRVRCRPGDGFLVRSRRLLATLLPRRRLAGDITALRARAVAINEQHSRYGFSLEPLRRHPPLAHVPAPALVPLCTAANSRNHHQLVGLRSQADTLVAMVMKKAGRSSGGAGGARAPPTNENLMEPPLTPSYKFEEEEEGKGRREEEEGKESTPWCSIPILPPPLAVTDHGKEDAGPPDSDTRLKVFSIVGFGGLGKTTLAMEVCRRLEGEFQHQALVSVSQAFDRAKDLKGLLKRVLHQIVNPAAHDGQGIKEEYNVGNIDTMDEDKLAAELKKTLNKRYLIVIDDVWSEAAWDAIQCVLPENNCGSRIIVTTRIDTVARACSDASDCIYRIKALSPEDSKKLFLSRVFGSTNGACPTREIEDVMQKILRKCGGLPLAIISIASLLASYKSPESIHMWETVLKSIGSHMESHPTLEGMRQIVVLSYDHLPHHLKACMMYLSIFPEDFVIVKERLLRRWIAEGLVAEKLGLTAMEVAEGYFSELVSRSMIDMDADIVTYYDGREETCRVHDMMLEVMVTKSLEANFVSLIGGQYEGMSYDRVRRLSIHAGEGPSSMSSKKTAAGCGSRRNNGIKGLNVQNVRSLSMFEFEGHHLLSRLGEFTLLRVLDLQDCQGLGKRHMACVCRMYLLRFLNLRGTDISVLPPGVGQLEHLQTLDVRLTFLKGLPETVTELENLESLQFSNKDDYVRFHWEAPRGLRKMKALRKVNNVVVTSNTEVAKEIAELGQLQELTIFVPSGIPRDVVEVLDHSLSRLYSLRFLNIEIFGNRKEENFLHRLESRSPPRLLRYLRMCGSLGDRTLTHWVGLLTNLVEFVIAWAYLCGDTLFDVLCKLPNLKKLTLETNFYADTEIVAKTTQSFPVLTELRMFNNNGVPAIYRFEKGSMPKLETLVLKFDVRRQSIVGIEHLTNLKEVQFTGKKGNSGAMEDELKKLKEENGRREHNGSNQLTVKVRYE